MEKTKIEKKDQEKKISDIIFEIDHFLTEIEEDIESNLDSSGFINIPFESRLLESILLASYFKWYFPNTDLQILSNRMLMQVFNKTIQISSSVPALDLNIQKLLFDLYNQQYSASYEQINYWHSQYQVLLNEAFIDDLIQNRMKKILFFDLIALFCCPNKEIRQILFRVISKNFIQILTLFESSFHQDKDSHWNSVYPLLFQLITQKFGLSNLFDCLQQLMLLQSNNGTWFQNHTLTLIVLHSIRLYYHPIMNDFVQEGLTKGEFYIKGYLNSGMSIIRSMNIFNSVLFYSQQSYFKKIDPPLRLIESLLEYQKESGGWTSDISLTFTDWDVSGFAILALIPYWKRTRNLEVFKALKNSTNYLNIVKKDDGSFSVYADGTETLAEMVARGIMVLAKLPDEFINPKDRFNLISKGLEWLDEKQSKGVFEGQSYSASKIYPLSQVALAISYLMNSQYLNDIQKNELYPKIKKLTIEIINYLKDNQNSNGSYAPIKGFPITGEQQSTAYAVIAWGALDPYSKEFFKTLNFLLSSISIPVKSYPEGTGPRPIRYNDLSHGKIFVYIAFLVAKYSCSKLLLLGEYRNYE